MTFLIPDWRSPEERYGIYVIRGRALTLLATCDCYAALGVALGTLAEEGEFENIEGFGVLDSHGDPEQPGVWLVNPFNSRRLTI